MLHIHANITDYLKDAYNLLKQLDNFNIFMAIIMDRENISVSYTVIRI